tara:strand:- start:678 stop:2333 length:1656 start_codon:yes stop_codon:yes gene_type:complete
MTNENTKIVVIGHVEETNDKQTKVRYEAVSGPRSVWIPKGAIAQQHKTSDGQSAFLVESASLKHGDYHPSAHFGGNKAPLVVEPEHIELVDALEQGVASANIKAMQKAKKASIMDLGGSPNNDGGDEDWDDEVPTTAGAVEVSDEVWDGSILAGGREGLIAHDWRFTPVMKPVFTAHQESEEMAPTFSPVTDAKGNAKHFAIFNPSYASSDRPEGACLGVVGKDYFPLSYPTVCDPILDMASKNDWKARVYAHNEGAKMRLDCDVSQAAQTREKARQRLSENGHGFISLNLMNDTAKSLDGLYRYGFSINNSLDGTKALSVQAVAERVYCQNLAVMGGVRTIASIRHKQGAMKDRDWDAFASDINSVIVDAQRSLVEMEFMQHLPVDVQLFERLLTLCETRGLIGWPNKKPVIKNDKVVSEKLTGGYMWRLALDGWTKPSNDWVAVNRDQSNTLFHAYNVLNGAITHKPEWSDGKTVLKGRTIGLETLNRRLSTVHNVMTGVLYQTVGDYKESSGVDKIGTTDLNDLKAFVNEEGMSALNSIPKASEVLNI